MAPPSGYTGYSLLINVTGLNSSNDYYQESSQLYCPSMRLQVAAGNIRVLGRGNMWYANATAVGSPTIFVTAPS